MSRKISVLLLALALVAALAPAANLDFNNPTGTHGLIMIDKLGGFVRFFDPVSLKELSSFAIPEGPPHELAISPDHKTAYIPVYGDGVYGRNPHPGHVIAIVPVIFLDTRSTIAMTSPLVRWWVCPPVISVPSHWPALLIFPPTIVPPVTKVASPSIT